MLSKKEERNKEMICGIADFINKNRLLDHEHKHIVALSGGADSVALLRVLLLLGYSVEAAHCNFSLRGDESDRDEQFCHSLCEKLSVQFHLIHFDTYTYAQQHQVSIEMAARQLRYHYFEQLRHDIGAGEVCVAHHRDDAVETLLMNMIRGTGIHGLTGIRPRNGHIVRPLLCVSRTEILRFLNEIDQNYVIDSTNLVPDVMRNKLRLKVIPLLRQINPAASENIAKTASRLAEAERFFDSSMKSTISKLFINNTLEIATLLAQPAPEYLLFELLKPYAFVPGQVEQIFNSLTGSSGRTFYSPTHEVVINRGQLIVCKRLAPLPSLRIPELGVYRYSDSHKFRFETTKDTIISKSPERATLDADKVIFPLTIRPVEAGDRFQPFGMAGRRLVNDYLTDLKLSLPEKRRQLVITDAEGAIIWVVGRRTNQRFAVTDAAARVLEISYE